jgi:hypothetical protein
LARIPAEGQARLELRGAGLHASRHLPRRRLPGTFTNWIELSNENIAAGCGGGNSCPGNPNNRGQRAVFVTKAFNPP